MTRFRRSPARALVLLACAGCAAPPREEAPPSPRHLACAAEVKQMQGSCNPDLLRTQGSDCSAAAARIIDRCGEAP